MSTTTTTALPSRLAITPITRPVSGPVTLPGSKSLTNRALLLAALCEKPITFHGALFSEDTTLMATALRSLGCLVDADAEHATVKISGGKFQKTHADAAPVPTHIHVGLAGTAARFLTAFCAALPSGVYIIDGVAQMRKRPMRGLIDALRSLGAEIKCLGEEGFFPIEIHSRGLRGSSVTIDARESSQMLSALLMIAPLAGDDIEITVSGGVRWPFVEMTARLMEQFGQPSLLRRGDDKLLVKHGSPYRLASGDSYEIEPDATAASYYLALPMVTGGSLALYGLHLSAQGLQGDTRFANVLASVGMKISETGEGLVSTHTRTDALHGVAQNFNEFSDTFLTLAALAPLLNGPTKITGIAHTRKQETDRVSGMAHELRKLGQHVIETEDSLEIHPRPLLEGQIIETYHDHRFAMSFGILGCHDLHGDGRSWLTIDNPACCAKTFPHFFDLLETVRVRSLGERSTSNQ